MNARVAAAAPIHAHLVPDWEVQAFKIRFFGIDGMPSRHGVARAIATHAKLETLAFEHVSLSNGGMYLAPALPCGTILQWRDGETVRSCSAMAAGIRSSLIELDMMARENADYHYAHQYMRLVDFAEQHLERKFILDRAS